MDISTTEIEYEEINIAVTDIQMLLGDVSYTVSLGQLNSVFEYSQSDYVDKLKTTASCLMEINNIVNDLLVKSKDMLSCAKMFYQDTDLSAKNSVENASVES